MAGSHTPATSKVGVMGLSANNAAMSKELLVRPVPDIEADHGTPEAVGRDAFSHNTIHVGGMHILTIQSTSCLTVSNHPQKTR